MIVGSGSTSETLKCIVCKKTTYSYDAISQGGLEIKVPVCKDHFGNLNMDSSIGNLMTGIKSILLTEVKAKEEEKVRFKVDLQGNLTRT